MRLLFVDGHAAAPTVADQQGILRVAEGERVIQSGANPAAKNVAGVVGIAMEGAEEDGGRFEGFAGEKFIWSMDGRQLRR